MEVVVNGAVVGALVGGGPVHVKFWHDPDAQSSPYSALQMMPPENPLVLTGKEDVLKRLAKRAA